MRWLPPLYVVVTIISAAVALVPDLSVYLVLFTLGLGLPLLFAPTVLLYMTASWPLLAAIHARRRPRRDIPVALFILVAVALLPGALSRVVAQMDAASFVKDDAGSRLSTSLRRLEIERPARFYGGRFDPLATAPCDALCQALLLNRELDEIRVSVRGASGSATGRSAVVYSYARRSGCPRAFASADLSLHETQRRASRGECIIAKIDAAWSPSPKLTVTTGRDWPASLAWLHRDRRFTRYELFESSQPGALRLALQTDLETSVLALPLTYGPLPSYGLEIRMGVRRTLFKPASQDIEAFLRRFTRLPVQPLLDSPEEPAIAAVERILSSSTSEPFGPELMASINRYIDKLSAISVPNDSQLSLLYRMMADARVTDHFRLSQYFQRRPHLAGPVIEPILELMERPAPESRGHDQSHLAWILVRTPIESLRPFASRILSTAALSTDWHYAPLMRIAGRLGTDPTELFLARLRGQQSHARANAIVGVCMADEPWRSRLVPEVEDILRRTTMQRYNGQTELGVALIMLGEESAAITAFIARLSEQDAARLRSDAANSRRYDCPRG